MKHLPITAAVISCGVLGVLVTLMLLEVGQVAAQTGGISLGLSPSNIVVPNGSPFDVDITVSATGSVPVQEAQVFLDFDPTFLRVISSGQSTGPLIPGTSFLDPSKYFSQSKVDPTTGQIEFLAVASATGNTVSVPFVLASIQFQAIAATPPEGTFINFHTTSPRRTLLLSSSFQGTNTSQGVTVRITEAGEGEASALESDGPEPTRSGDDPPSGSDEVKAIVSGIDPTPMSEIISEVPNNSEKKDSDIIKTQPLSPKNSSAPATVRPEQSAAIDNLGSKKTSAEQSESQPDPAVEEKVVEKTNSDSSQVWLFLGLGLSVLIGSAVTGGYLWRHKYSRIPTGGLDQAYEQVFRNFNSPKR